MTLSAAFRDPAAPEEAAAQETRERLVRAQLILTPERSDRQIARDLGISHHTVGKTRNDLKGRGQIAHVPIVTDTLGREQPRQRKAKFEWDKTESLREMPFEAPDTAEAIPAAKEVPAKPEEAAVKKAPQAPF